MRDGDDCSLVRFRGSALTYAEAPTASPTAASAPQVQMSTRAKRQTTLYQH